MKKIGFRFTYHVWDLAGSVPFYRTYWCYTKQEALYSLQAEHEGEGLEIISTDILK